MKDFDEKLQVFIANNPNLKTEWDELIHDDSRDDFDEDTLAAGEFNTPAHREKYMSMAKNAISETAIAPMEGRRRFKAMSIIAAVAAVLVLFMTVTPTGRGVAQELSDYIVAFFGGEMHIEKAMEHGLNPANTGFSEEYFTDLKEAAEFMGYPIIGIYDGSAKLDYARIEQQLLFYTIETMYYTPDGKEIIFNMSVDAHDFEEGSMSGVADASGAEKFEHKLYNGETLYCLTNEEGIPHGSAFWSNIQVFIASKDMKWDELLIYVDKLQPAYEVE